LTSARFIASIWPLPSAPPKQTVASLTGSTMSSADETESEGPKWVGVVERVGRGEITLEEAERWAAENGGGNISKSVEADSAKRFKEANWPFFLAVAWLMSRRPEEAVEKWTRYRQWGRRLWVSEPWKEAVDELLHQLRVGSLKATAIRFNERTRIDIDSAEWHDLTWERVGAADIVASRGLSAPAYVNLLVPSADVQRLWKPKSKAETNAKRAIATEERCEEELFLRMRKSPTEPVAKAILRGDFPGLSARAFNRAYREAAERADALNWIAAGRRKSTPP
jgi:hypothetical protein